MRLASCLRWGTHAVHLLEIAGDVDPLGLRTQPPQYLLRLLNFEKWFHLGGERYSFLRIFVSLAEFPVE
jgi:hypothetical protein